MEDKLTRVRTLISKNIGRSQTDLMRAFENIKEELMNLYETSIPVQTVTDGIDEKVMLVIEDIHCIVWGTSKHYRLLLHSSFTNDIKPLYFRLLLKIWC